MTKVTIEGFKTPKQAQEFIDWYEGGGEQQFYEHLEIVDMSPEDGCNIDCHKNYDYDAEMNITAYLEKY